MNAERWRLVKPLLQQALELAGDERRAHLDRVCGEDAALRGELLALMDAHAAAGDRFEAPPHALLEEPPDRVGPYRVLRELGRGGMGAVYLAVREGDELAQPVAVKVIQRGMDSASIVRRFRNERLILAALHHPSIARLYEGGTTADGLPYFVMEYVDGEPLDVYCASRGLGIEQRLRLFREVCAAVQYAHQNLVVHRDLKPTNILVTREGVPKLLDFGIAKLLDPMGEAGAAELTAAELPLTPEYASPEQLRGEAVSTVSDVYSLGVVLYRLLTGRLPYRFATRHPQEVLRVVAESAPEPPKLAGDLDNVVLKALHKEPARRYASAEQLGEDLRRHLEGFPVRARPDTAGYRARKFVGRHRIAVAASAAAVAVLLATTGTALWQARLARSERARAERRFADVRRLANVVLFDVSSALEGVSGGLEARRLLVDTALRYLDDLAREAGDEPALLQEVAAAYERVGELQGMPEWPSAGRSGDALASFGRALELRRRGRAAGATAADEAEARLLLRIGSVLAARGETAAALTRHREALALLDGRGAARTTASWLQRAQTLVAVGDDLWELGDVPAATAPYREALLAAKAASAADRASTDAIRQAGVIEQRLGDAAAETKDWARALEHHRASLAVDRQLATRRRDDAEIRRDLGTDLSRLGVDHANLGQLADALAQHQEAMRLREALLAAEPLDARALDDAAESRMETGAVLARLGRAPEAVAEIGVAVERRKLLVERDPSNARWRDVLAGALTTLAVVELDRDRPDAATQALEEALAIRRKLAVESPDFAANRPALDALEKALAGLRRGQSPVEVSAALEPWR